MATQGARRGVDHYEESPLSYSRMGRRRTGNLSRIVDYLTRQLLPKTISTAEVVDVILKCRGSPLISTPTSMLTIFKNIKILNV